MTAVDPALAFARAIVKPGGSALLIGSDHRRREWVAVPSAVESGECFAVEPREGIVAMDVDTNDDRTWADNIRSHLADGGFRFVVTDSGREGHQHIWMIGPPGWSNVRIVEECMLVEGAGSSGQIRHRQATRPPFAPHRQGEGVRSTVVEPDPETALSWFEGSLPGPIPDQTQRWVDTVDPADLKINHGSPSRSNTLHAVACSMVNARWTLADFRSLLINSPGLLGQKCQEQPNPFDFTQRAWALAEEFVRENPSRPSSSVARDDLAELHLLSDHHPWSPRTGSFDRAVYLELIRLGIAGATLDVSASVRQLAGGCNIGKDAASSALKRLREQRLLADATTSRGFHYANVHRLLPVGRDVKGSVLTDNSGLTTGGESPVLSASTNVLLADIFSGPPGLGIAKRSTWEAMPVDRHVPTSEIRAQRIVELRIETIRSHLRTLCDWGLVDRQGNRSRRTIPSDTNLVRVAQGLGVRGRNANRAEYNQRQSSGFRDKYRVDFKN